MSDRVLSWIVLGLLFVGAGSATAGYYYGHHQGFAKGYTQGKNDAPKPDYYKEDQYGILKNRLEFMENQYNDLVNKYNSVSNQKQSPLRCTTTNYDLLHQSSTVCY